MSSLLLSIDDQERNSVIDEKPDTLFAWPPHKTPWALSNPYNWISKLPFGKYKGRTVMNVYGADPEYLAYAYKAWNTFNLTEEILERLDEYLLFADS